MKLNEITQPGMDKFIQAADVYMDSANAEQQVADDMFDVVSAEYHKLYGLDDTQQDYADMTFDAVKERSKELIAAN